MNRDRRGSTWPGAQRRGEGSSVPVDRKNRDRASTVAAGFCPLFLPRQDFLIFSIYLFCVLYSIKWYHIYKATMKEPQYILHIIITNISYTPSHSSCLVKHVLHKRYSHEFDLINLHRSLALSSKK